MVLKIIEPDLDEILEREAWVEGIEGLVEDNEEISYEELVHVVPELGRDEVLASAVLEALERRDVEVLGQPDANEDPPQDESTPYTPADIDHIPADDLLSVYLAEQAREPLLSHDEEIELARQIERGRRAEKTLLETDYTPDEFDRLQAQINTSEAARERLAQANTRLVISIAKRYRNLGLPFSDLIQEGNVGLMRAVDRYDPESGNRFSTYATWWIRQAVTRSLANHGRVIRIPIHTGQRMRAVAQIGQRMEKELGRKPSPEEIAEEMDEPVGKVQQLMQWASRPLSLEQPFGDEGDAELGDFIEDRELVPPEEMTDSNLLDEAVETLLGLLTAREARVLRLRFGLEDGQAYTLKEIAGKFDLSRERIRQIERQALLKLRLVAPNYRLEDFLDRE